MTILFSNNATSTLAGSISNVATTANLSAGTGALFPNPTGGDYFVLTFTDAATGLLTEIVHVTARSTDTITIVRAQEGTAAQAWAAGDLASNLFTAGQMGDLLQDGDALALGGAYAVDAGSANAVSITLSPTPASYAEILGTQLRVKVAADNTGATTFAVVGLGSLAVKNPDGTALAAGQLQGSGIATLVYDGTAMQLQSIAFPTAPLASPAFSGTPTAPTAAPGTSTTQIATTAFVAAAITALTTYVNNLVNALFGSITDQTGSRALGGVYTNSSGRPMFVMVYAITGGLGVNLNLSVNGTIVETFGQPNTSGQAFVAGMVPNGSTYEVSNSVGPATLQGWFEVV